MADKLSIYNHALTEIEQRTVASLTDSHGGEALRLLDRNWTRIGNMLIEAGSWNWAVRQMKLDPDPDVSVAFGYQYAFTKPADWKRTHCISPDERFLETRLPYLDITGWWYADWTPIYVRYISGGDGFGWNVGAWTESFANAMGLALASAIAPKVTSSDKMKVALEQRARKALTAALALDAANQAQDRLPVSNWARARTRWPGVRQQGYPY